MAMAMGMSLENFNKLIRRITFLIQENKKLINHQKLMLSY